MVKLKVKAIHEVPHYYCDDKCSPLFVKNNIISVISDGKTVALWKPEALYEKRISLLGHEKTVTALSISPSDQKFLCSCSNDRIILWNLSSIQEDLQGVNPMGITFGFDIGYVEYCSFSWNNLWLALCKEKEIWIIKIQVFAEESNEIDITHHTSLDTNSIQGNICAFSPEYYDMLITVEDCSYFKIWNLQTTTLLYQSPSLGMHSITHCAFSNNPSKLLLGTNRGVIYVYNMKQQTVPCCVMNENVGKIFNKNTKMSPGCAESGYNPQSAETCSEGCGEVGCIIFGMYLFRREFCPKNETVLEEEVPGFSWDTKAILKCILAPGAIVIVCCNLGIVLYDCNSSECCAKLIVSDMIPGTAFSSKTLAFMNFVVLGGETLNNLMCIIRTPLGKSKLNVIMLGVEDSGYTLQEDVDYGSSSTVASIDTSALTVMSCEPVGLKSPLRYQMSPRVYLSEYDPKTPPVKVLRKPKSSGYGIVPRSQMFCPIINKPRTFQSTAKLAKKSTVNHFKSSNSDIMVRCGPPVKTGNKICIWDTSGTAIHLAVSGDGNNLACSSTSSHICILKFANMSTEKSVNLIGHDGAINSLHFSLDSRWLVSGSSDSTAKVWDWKNKKYILNIDKTTKYSKVNGKLQQDSDICSISQARFFYMDQFILMATGGCLELYSHILHETECGSKILQPKMGCKRIRKIDVPTQQVTCFSAANQFHSYLVLCGCSNHAIQVYDLNVERFLLELQNVHVRPVHQLCQMEGSHSVSHPPGMYDLFLTAALCDSVKLWDLRSARCIQKYCQHINRAYTSGIDVSPCGRFVAVGSEDKCVYIYDTRWCAEYIEKLCGLGEVVMDVAFNPCKPLLVAAALNGYITSYSSQDI